MKDIPIYVYEFQAWNSYLFPAIFPASIRIKAKVADDHHTILKTVGTTPGYFLFHLNLTNTSHFIRDRESLCHELLGREIKPLNNFITDTSKRYIQEVCSSANIKTCLADLSGDPDELLIIKTNRNYYGQAEESLLPEERKELSIELRPVDRKVIYRLFKRKEITGELWRREDYTIEKYITNKLHLFYRVYKLIDRLVITEVIDYGVVKKASAGMPRVHYFIDSNNISEVHRGFDGASLQPLIQDIHAFCRHIRLDFGAIDVVRNDDLEYFIIDVNCTPFWKKTEYELFMDHLAGGITR
jgi:hypothetical protein